MSSIPSKSRPTGPGLWNVACAGSFWEIGCAISLTLGPRPFRMNFVRPNDNLFQEKTMNTTSSLSPNHPRVTVIDSGYWDKKEVRNFYGPGVPSLTFHQNVPLRAQSVYSHMPAYSNSKQQPLQQTRSSKRCTLNWPLHTLSSASDFLQPPKSHQCPASPACSFSLSSPNPLAPKLRCKPENILHVRSTGF